MSDPENSDRSDKTEKLSHWRILAEELGTPIPEEPVEPEETDETSEETSDSAEQPAGGATPEGDVVTQPERKRTPPPRATSDWGSLAMDLGIEVPPPTISEEDKSPAPVEAELPTDEPVVAARPLAEEVFAEPAMDDDITAEPTGPPDLEDREDREGELGVSFFEPDTTFEIDTADVGLDADQDNQEVATEEPVESTALGDDEDSSELTDQDKQPPARRRRRRGRRRTAAADRETADEDSVDEPSEADGDGVSEADSDTAASESEDAEDDQDESDDNVRSRGRRSRRRRRRPSRKTDDVDGPQGDEATGQQEETTDEEEENEDEDEKRAPGRKSDETKGETTGRTKHRKIPTWEEAVSVIVSTNLENRSKSGSGSKGKSRSSRRRRGGSDRK